MIQLRIFQEADIDLLYTWFQETHVKEYWHHKNGFSYDLIALKYKKRLREGTISMFIFQYFGIDIGFIQCYPASNIAEYGQKGKAFGIDLFIGENTYLYRGIGSIVISKVINSIILENPDVKYICIDPEVRNQAAIRAYSKVGFVHVKTDMCPDQKVSTYYMIYTVNK